MGVPADIETAVYYLKLPTAVTNDEFHRIGGQPVVEADRINDKTAPVVSKGNHGDDDELIQHQKVRAQEGHLPSMLAMGDLYYYGARGLPRDQSMALRYFEQAADSHGDPTGMCAAAGMYLKGEGAEKNVSRAISLYENASSTGSIRALVSRFDNYTRCITEAIIHSFIDTNVSTEWTGIHVPLRTVGAEEQL